MAFQLATAQRAANGRATAGEVTYEAPWQITVDSATDGPAAIFAYLRSTSSAPWLGRPFSYGGDTDAAATCREITGPKRSAGHDKLWTFEARYSTAVEGRDSRPNSSGDPTDWPLDWRPEVYVSWAQHEKPCETAIYRGGFTHAVQRFVEGQTYAPQNSAFEVYDPPLMKDFSRATFRCRFWAQLYDMAVAGEMIDGVNEGATTWDTGTKIFGGFGPRTMKVADVQGQPKREFREHGSSRVWLDYMEIDVELQYNRDGWRDQVVDRGLRKAIEPGDADGFGGTFSLVDLLAKKAPPNAAIVGVDGHPLSGPVLLNGAGAPKDASDRTPVLITWQKYREFSFLAHPYLGRFFQ